MTPTLRAAAAAAQRSVNTTSPLVSAPHVAVARYVPGAAVCAPFTVAQPEAVRFRCQLIATLRVPPAGTVTDGELAVPARQSAFDQMRSLPEYTTMVTEPGTAQAGAVFLIVAVKLGAVPAG